MSNIIDLEAEREKRKPLYPIRHNDAEIREWQEQQTRMFEWWMYAFAHRFADGCDDKPDGAA